MCKRGFSLVELLVGVAIMGIFMMVMSGYISSISNQQRMLMQKADAVAIDTNFTNLMMATSGNCTGNITAAVVTVPHGAAAIGLTKKLACQNPPLGPGGCLLSGLDIYNSAGTQPDIITGPQPDGLTIQEIDVQITGFAAPNEYTGNIILNYGGVPPVPPAMELPMTFTSTTAGPTDTLQTCAQGTCDNGFYLEEGKNGEDPFCIQKSVNPSVTFYQASQQCGVNHTHLCTETEWEEACFSDRPSFWGNPYGDGGPILHLGEDGGNGSEWVDLLHLYNAGGGGMADGTIMGGSDPHLEPTGNGNTPQHTCTVYGQYKQWINGAFSTAHPYRCCYRP